MEDKQQLYLTFTKFVTLLGTMNGLPLKVIQKIITDNFGVHPYASKMLPEVKALEKVDEDIKFLFNECVRICDELGPSREYFTILTLLRNITHDMVENDKAEAKELSMDILEKFEHEIELINQKIPHPPLFNIVLESRSLIEWSSIYCFYPFIPKRIKGEGRPVLLIPPYLGDDYSTSFVRRYLTSLGFKTYNWEQGFNMIKSHYIPRLEE